MKMRQVIIFLLLSIIGYAHTETCQNEGSTRLVNSSFLQVCYGGGERRWTFICAERWSSMALNVYCRQLGYTRSNDLDEIGINESQRKCSREERSLIECLDLLDKESNCVYVQVNVSEECRRCQTDSECSVGICRDGRCECRENCTNGVCYQGSCDVLSIEHQNGMIQNVIIPLLVVGIAVAIIVIGVGVFGFLYRKRTGANESISSNRKQAPLNDLTIKNSDIEAQGRNITDSEEGLMNYPHNLEISSKETCPYIVPSVLNKDEVYSLESELYSILVEGEVTEYSTYAEINGMNLGTFTRLTQKYHNALPNYESEIGLIESIRMDPIYIEPPSSLPQLETVFGQCLNEIRRKEIQMGEEFASGQFGVVYRAVYHSERGDIPVAIKTLKEAANEDTKVAFMREAAILAQFQHPNVLRMIGVLTAQQPYMMVTELLKTELEELLLKLKVLQTSSQETTKRMSYAQIVNLPPLLLRFSREIAAGMNHLSEKHFIHRDLAARNVLVAKDLSCRIADFGMSRELHADSEYYTSSGGRIPLRWTAPEAVFYQKYSEKSDVWSFGMTMFEIWSLGDKPWGLYTSNDEIIQGMCDCKKLSPPTGCPRDVYRVMVETWRADASFRPTFSDVQAMLSGIQLPPPIPGVDHPSRCLGNDPLLAKDHYLDLQTIQ